ncbi:hypothetical protein NFI96_013857 [Prochilodus magdalenae]|nr:hypothetical protein NFI96_013857 [Prochilodus magdalenae]
MVEWVGAELWSTEQVSLWLKDQGFGHYVDLLCVKHRLDGAGLLSLTENDLRSPPLQLPLLGDIKRLTLSLRRLQRQHCPNGFSLSPEHWLCNGGGCNGVDMTGHPVRKDLCNGYSNGKCKRRSQLDPECWKTALITVYVTLVFGITSFIMVLVHEKVPDIHTYPPLPDIFLDSVPRIPWAFAMAEGCAVVLGCILLLTLLLHKHRSILFRRFCGLMGTVFLLRCVAMFVTSLSVPGHHLQCSGKTYGDMWGKLHRALQIWSGLGMSLTGVHTCGDYMFSGHTVVLTMLNFFITEYTPCKWHLVHTLSWVLNLFGIFFILAAHEHYSIDVFIAFYITTRLFLYYHTLSSTHAIQHSRHTPRKWHLVHTLSWVLNLFGIFFILAAHEHYSIDVFIAFYITTRLFLYYHTLSSTHAIQHSRRARVWFPLFSFSESNVNGPVPNEYAWPFSRPKLLKTLIG